MTYTYSLTVDEDRDILIAHAPECPAVKRARAHDRPVFTMLDCARPLSEDDVEHHDCLSPFSHPAMDEPWP